MSAYSPGPPQRPPRPPMQPVPPPPASRPAELPQGLALPLGKIVWTYILLASIILVFLIEEAFPIMIGRFLPYLPDYAAFPASEFRGGSENNLVLILLGANFRPLIQEGQVWRFFTAMFLHIGLMHLIFNAYALFIFGGEMERVYGGTRFLVIYILSGLFGSLTSFALGNAQISAGASGAIFGIIGMHVAYFYRHKNLLGEFGRTRLMNAAIIVGINLVFGLSVPGIDNLAHIGGLIAGFLLGFGLAPVYRVVRDQMGYPTVIDRTSFLSLIWVPIVAILFLVIGTITALSGITDLLLPR